MAASASSSSPVRSAISSAAAVRALSRLAQKAAYPSEMGRSPCSSSRISRSMSLVDITRFSTQMAVR